MLPRFLATLNAEKINTPAQNLPGPTHIVSDLGNNDNKDPKNKGHFSQKVLQHTATTLATGLLLILGGYTYHVYYQNSVISKIKNAFYSNTSTNNHDSDTPHNTEKLYIERPEQSLIDEIVRGNEAGHYWLIFGEKGTGKTSMLVHAMRDIHRRGVTMLDARCDINVFRLRLGRALGFAYSEDYLGGLFSTREPRDGTALLDIERAMNSLEKVAIRHREAYGRPLVLVINDIHHIQDHTEDGRRLLTLLQQRAESWAAGELVTVVFTSDEYRTSDLLRLHAARMNVMKVRDITVDLTVQSLKEYWLHAFWEEVPVETLERIYSMVGGRLSFVDEIAKSRDILKTCELICERERPWFLKKCWILGKNMHQGAKEQQEYSIATMTIAQALVKQEKDQKNPNSELPGIPLHEAQQLMTRADLPQKLNQMNILSIDDNDIVTASSVPMQSAFRAVCSEDGFKKQLQATTDRLRDIESLERTTEITMKDLVNDGQYEISKERGVRGRKISVYLIGSLLATLFEAGNRAGQSLTGSQSKTIA